jgi:hypothetical protein
MRIAREPTKPTAAARDVCTLPPRWATGRRRQAWPQDAFLAAHRSFYESFHGPDSAKCIDGWAEEGGSIRAPTTMETAEGNAQLMVVSTTSWRGD